jgi:hypothetical protein
MYGQDASPNQAIASGPKYAACVDWYRKAERELAILGQKIASVTQVYID